MSAILATLLRWIIVSSVARIFAGIVLSVTSQVFLASYANDALNAITSQANNMAGDVGKMFLMLGFGSFLSIVGTAFVTRIAIVQSAQIFGISTSPQA
jgi:hypothetical protein